MPDISLSPTGTPNYQAAAKLVPSYLITFNDNTFFIATKCDAIESYCKCVGFYYNGTEDAAISNYDEIIKSIDPKYITEIILTYHTIKSIRSLVYKHKGTNK
jgi:hypothetical protein